MKINTRQYAAYHKWLAEGAMREAVVRGIQLGVARARRDLVVVSSLVRAVDTRRYADGWKTKALADGAAIYNDTPYAAIIEDGRSPGSKQPPTEPIRRWVKRKLGVDAATAKALAFPIARAIGRRGLLAKRVLWKSLPLISKHIDQAIRNELARAVGRLP